jgi:arginase
MYDVDRLGIGKVMEECNDYLADKENLHLSFDIDAIDPFFAPHTGTAVTGGLTFRESNYICEALFASGRLNSMELVEVDPSQHKGMDPARTIDVAITLIGSAMGQKIL